MCFTAEKQFFIDNFSALTYNYVQRSSRLVKTYLCNRMKEDFSINENDRLIPEHHYYSEYNDSSLIKEHEQYSVEDSYVPEEFQDYEGSGSSALLSRHSSVMRKNRNRLGRLLALLAAVAVPAAIIIITLINSIYVDVRDYKAETESLNVKLRLHSLSETTEFKAVLTDRNGNVAGEAQVDRKAPELLFEGLEAGELYYLEVFADGESKLKLNYILPKEDVPSAAPSDLTAPPDSTGDHGGTSATPNGHGTVTPGPTAPPDATGTTGGTPTPPAVTEIPATAEIPTDIPTDIPTEIPPESPTVTPEITPEAPTDVPTDTPTDAPIPAVTLSSSGASFDYVTLTFAAANIDTADLIVSINDRIVSGTSDGSGNLTVTESGLSPGTQYGYTVTDKSGKQLLSGSITTARRSSVQITLSSFTNDLTWADLEFNIVNPDGNTVTATLDGSTCDFNISNNKILCAFSGLAENSNHTLNFYDWDGSLILSHQFSTRARAHASVSVTSETIGYDSASIRFAITNPDNNALSVRYDGTVIERSVSGSTYTLSRTGLVSGQTHTVEFLDYDGSVVFSRSFAARARTPATVSFTQIDPGFNKATVKMSVSNPDGNTLELRLNGTRVNADLSSSSPSATLTGLSPRTTYTVSVYDTSCSRTAASTSVTTISSFSLSQDGSGNATFMLTDAFKALYPNATLTITDSLGQAIPVTSPASGRFYAAANDIAYTDTYSVKITSSGSTVDTLSTTLTGKTRPSFSMEHTGYAPATLEEARTSEWNESDIKYPGNRYIYKSGHIDTVLENAEEYVYLEGKLRWTALIFKDSSGKVADIVVSGIGIEDTVFEFTKSVDIDFFIFADSSEIPAGNYKVAMYTTDGYDYEEMRTYVEDARDEGNTAARTALTDLFTASGRKITSEVNFNVTEDPDFGYGWAYEDRDAVIDGSTVTRAFRCAYVPPNEEDIEGFITVVAASDPATQLRTESLGMATVYGKLVENFTYTSPGPVYVIIYRGTFSPDNFLSVLYMPN